MAEFIGAISDIVARLLTFYTLLKLHQDFWNPLYIENNAFYILKYDFDL